MMMMAPSVSRENKNLLAAAETAGYEKQSNEGMREDDRGQDDTEDEKDVEGRGDIR